MKKVLSNVMAVSVVFGMGLSQSAAADTEPIAVLAVASYNDLVSDVDFVGSLIERPQLGAVMDGGVALITQFKGLVGVDKTRPWGAIVQASGEADCSVCVLVPLTDFKQALSLLELYSTVASEGDHYKLTLKNSEKVRYVKQHGTWAIFAEKPESLVHCDADPSALLGRLEKEHIVGGRLFPANVPAGLRKKCISGFRKAIEKEAAKKDSQSEEEFASRKRVLDQAESCLARVFGELDQIVFVWGLDRTAGKVFADVSVIAKSGTTTAEEMGLATKSMTNLAGIRVPGAAFTATLAGTIPAAQQQFAASLIESMRVKGLLSIEKKVARANRALRRGLLNDCDDLLQEIVENGRLDGAATVLVGPRAATGLLASYVADGAMLDKILHTIAKAASEDHSEIAQYLKCDVEKSRSINFHKASLPIPNYANDRGRTVQLTGETLDIVIGVGKEYAYVAVGRDAMETLKKAIDGSARSGAQVVSPLEISLAAQPVTSLLAAVGKLREKPQSVIMESELDKAPGKDHAIFVVRPISNGVQARLEIEQGLIHLFGDLGVFEMEQHKSAVVPAAKD
jgi:hypothetical protein